MASRPADLEHVRVMSAMHVTSGVVRVTRATLLVALVIGIAACPSPIAVPVPPLSPRAAVDSAFTKPLTFSLLEDYEKGEDLEGIRNDFRLMHELGVSTWRGSFGWDDLEPERGRYDFAWLHAFAEMAASEGILLRPYIGYTPQWAAVGRMGDGAHWNDPPAELGSWTAFVATLAREMQRHPNLVSYEIYNEQNTRSWWDGTPAEYFQVLAGAGVAIRASHPGAQVIMGGLMWPDTEWLDWICGELGGGAAFDVLAFHAYPGTLTEDSVTVETYLDAAYHEEFVPRADSACGGKPIWLNELGSATAGRTTEEDQANWWARAITTYAADPHIEHLGIYEIRDLPPPDPAVSDDPNYHFGLVYADGTRKLAFSTVQLLVALLNTDSLVVADGEPEIKVRSRRTREFYRHLFVRPDGRQVLIMWDRDASPTLDVRLPRGGSRATSYWLDGSGAPLDIRGGTVRGIRLRPGEVSIVVIDP